MAATTVNGKWPLAVSSRQAGQFAKTWKVLDRLNECIDPDMYVCVAGVGLGEIAVLAMTFADRGRALLIEPQTEYWPIIRQTFEANRLKPPLQAFTGFASHQPTEFWRAHLWGRWPDGTLDVGDPEAPALYLHDDDHLPQCQIEDLMVIPDVIWVDVGGAEMLALMGADNILVDHHPDVFVGLHPHESQTHYGYVEADLFAFMHKLEYDWEVFDDTETTYVRFYREIHAAYQPPMSRGRERGTNESKLSQYARYPYS